MIGYTTLGTNDLNKAIAFYDELLADLNAKQVMNDGRIVVWAGDDPSGMIAVCTPYDKQAASVGNGTMIAINAGSKDMVEKLHKKALSLGAKNEGEVGPRQGPFYGGYFRDPDGNKLAVFCMAG